VRALTVRRGSARLAVRRFGRSGPQIVLIHGLASTQRIWDLVIPRLERSFRVTTFDQRGHGESSKPTTGYGFDDVTKDLGALLRAIGARKPILVGHSYGANVAIEYATGHPRTVAGLMSVDGGMGSISEIMDWKEAREFLAPPRYAGAPFAVMRKMVKDNVGSRWSEAMEPIVRSFYLIDDRDRVKPRLSRANHMRILRAMYDQKPKELLARLKVPVLMYCARPRSRATDDERDFYEMKRNSTKQIRAANPNVMIEWITSIHDIPLDRPRELTTRIAQFTRAATISGSRHVA
jgi:pimeloyl-ACP methyl ester carboxylesterase